MDDVDVTPSAWSTVDLAARMPRENAEHGLDIDARTGRDPLGGEAMDYGIAIDALLYRTRKAEAERQSKPE